MEFIRRLAPPRATDRSHAFVLVPSRFATERPLRAVAPPPTAGPLQENDRIELPAHLFSPSDGVRAGNLSEGGHLMAEINAASRPEIGQSGRELSVPVVSLPADAHPAQRDSRRVPVSPRVSAEPPSRLAPVDRQRAAKRDVNAVAAKPMTKVPPHLSVQAAAMPVSEAALAALVRQGANQRPVINVTIDRIEVRAPTSLEPPAAHPKPRSAASSVTLSEYLRGRGPARAGGAS